MMRTWHETLCKECTRSVRVGAPAAEARLGHHEVHALDAAAQVEFESKS